MEFTVIFGNWANIYPWVESAEELIDVIKATTAYKSLGSVVNLELMYHTGKALKREYVTFREFLGRKKPTREQIETKYANWEEFVKVMDDGDQPTEKQFEDWIREVYPIAIKKRYNCT